MKRIILTIGLSVAALALLGALVLQSRPVPVYVHVAHHAAIADLERTAEDFSSLITALNSAWASAQEPSEGARTLAARVAESPVRLSTRLFLVDGGTSQENRVLNRYESYTVIVEQTESLIADLFAAQAVYVKSVAFIRDSGLQIIEQMRSIGLDSAATDTFQLVVGTLDYATADVSVDESELRGLLVSLGRDLQIDGNVTVETQRLLDSVTVILDNKWIIQSRVNQIAEMTIPDNVYNLIQAAEDLYRSAVTSADQGRALLSIYALLLLATAGFIAFRLKQSYGQLNRANASLEDMNESLEQRVIERTDELAGTLKNLKESQVQLVQAEKMSSLGQLVAGISHEINTPLLYLENNSALVQERLEIMERFVKCCIGVFALKPRDYPDSKAFQRNFLEALQELKVSLREDEIETNIEEARDLMRDSIEGLKDLAEMAYNLKDFSRLDRSPVANFDVNAGLERSLMIARNALKYKASVRTSFGELPEIECRPSQINQIFLNILTNAAQAIEEEGEIIIVTKLHGPDQVSISITDNGCGIPEDNLSQLRDPFFTTKEVGMGTGLGLSIVDEIVRAHGGELVIESEVHKGSSFTILLPIKQPSEMATEKRDVLISERTEQTQTEELAEAS